MTDLMNRQYYLASRPEALPTEKEVPVRDVAVRSPEDGEVVLRTLYISLDPAIRGWMSDAPNYVPPIPVGDAVSASTIGRIVESKSPDFEVGDVVFGWHAWERYSTVNAAGLTKISEDAGLPLTNYMSVLGPTGLTAYFGLLDVGKPKQGDTVLVSAAAGAVGSIVGQIAKIKGCRVIGIAGTDAKCQWIKDELGFDDAINYKTCGDMNEAIGVACPEGIDVYFDNVGGEILDAALLNLNHGARISFCGWISTYNASGKQPGPYNLWQLVAKSASMQGFVVVDYVEQFGSAIEELAGWLMAGKIKFKEEVVDGLDNVLPTFLRLFDGSNEGKLIVRVTEED